MLVSNLSDGPYGVVARSGGFAGAVTVALALLGSPAALAQNCGNLTLNGPSGPWFGAIPPIASGLSAALAIGSAVSAANTAFLTQSTEFVSAPGNPKPDSEGSGIWIRGVGGELTLNSNTSVNGSLTVPPNTAGVSAGPNTGSTACGAQFRQTFSGFQLGYDLAKLNVGGWNLTSGTTAGFLETNGSIVGGNIFGGAFNSTTQAPFVGLYGTATYGSFFIDGLIRTSYFQTNVDSPTAAMFDQKIDAHGFTAALSTGYKWDIPNSKWFIEPSAGIVWSRETVDPFNGATLILSPGTNLFGPGLYNSTTQVDPLESIIGRLGIRIGTFVELDKVVLEPFAAVSIWHDFAGDQTANFTTCPNCYFTFHMPPGPTFPTLVPSTLAASLSTNNIGTFGQYSLGVSGQLKDTGWLGFARVDYREGPEMHGLSATGGIRYQFTPTETASTLPVKVKAPVDHDVNWSGWYGGVIGGANEFGHASFEFPGVSTSEMRPSGWLGGAALGYNFQAGKWVYGLEGDIAATNTSGSSQCAPLVGKFNTVLNSTVPSPLFQTTCHDSLNWIATTTARLGYAWTTRSLLYVKAGGAFADEKASITCNLGPFFNSNSTQSCFNPTAPAAFPPTNFIDNPSVRSIRVGWTIGVGTEFALTDRWSIKGEFDWLDFGTKALTLSDGTATNSTLHIAEGKIGLNYKLWP